MSYKHKDTHRNGEFRDTSVKIIGETLSKKLDTMIDNWNTDNKEESLGDHLPDHKEGNYCPLIDLGCEKNIGDELGCGTKDYMHCYSLVIGGLLGF